MQLSNFRLLGLFQFKHDHDRRGGSDNVVELSGQLLPQSGLLDTYTRAESVAHRVPVRFDKHRTANRLPVRLRLGGRNESTRKPNDDRVRIPR